MKITNKMPRGLAITAAVLMLIFLLISLFTQLLSYLRADLPSNPSALLWNLVSNVVSYCLTLLIIIVLFRSKKDTFSAVVFILSALETAISLGLSLTNRDALEYMPATYQLGDSVLLIHSVLVLIFHTLLVVESFKPGALSDGMRRLLLIFLPIIGMFLGSFGNVLQQFAWRHNDEFGMFMSAFVMAFVYILTYIPTILMGVAFSIPVKEKVLPPVQQPPFFPPVPHVYPPHF